MLFEELFSRRIMTMGPSPVDPARQVGVLTPEVAANLLPTRTFEMAKARWLAGTWTFENVVPATRFNPAYTDIGSITYTFDETAGWIYLATAAGTQVPHITFDPLSGMWIYALLRGAYGVLRSAEGWKDNRIVFSGSMTMVGSTCEWRMTMTQLGEDRFLLVNEEAVANDTFAYIDEWRFMREA